MKGPCSFPVVAKVAVGLLFIPFLVSADVVLKWNALMLGAITVETTPPPMSGRNLAILHLAIYDAVNGVVRQHQPYLIEEMAPPGTMAEIAAAAAARRVMLALYPSQQALIELLFDQEWEEASPGTGRDQGRVWGEYVAEQLLAWRSADGSSTSIPYIPQEAPGQWRRTPPLFRPPELPHWSHVTPFAMRRADHFRPPGPPGLAGAIYAADFNEVKSYGAKNSSVRTEDQTQMARFWSDFSYTVTPVGHWNRIADAVTAQQGIDWLQNARLFALLNMALADAAILTWDAKYNYNFWRPVTAIRQAASVNNPDTIADAEWESLLPAPPFPEYISGHSTFSRAAAEVLARFFGTDQMVFHVGSDSLPGITRTYTSFSLTAEECGQSRIYGGIHFSSANRDGQVAGQRLGCYVMDNFLLPLSELPRVRLLSAASTSTVLQLHGIFGRPYVIEYTPDFRQWFPLMTNTATWGGVVIPDAGSLTTEMRFYRAVEP